jgi:DNA-binding MurR/RpiR family transcriptional regulator
MEEEDTPADVKAALVSKYRGMFVDKLTLRDLQELQFYVRNQIDENHRIDPVCRLKLEFKLRQYFPEEVLRREIASIESLIEQLNSTDLRKPRHV